MQCRAQWTTKFLVEKFGGWSSSNTKDGYRTHQKRLYMESQKSKIPDLLTRVGDMDQISKDRKRLKELEPRYQEIQKKIDDLYKKLYPIRDEIGRLRQRQQNRENGVYEETLLPDGGRSKPPSVVCACPYEECRGMISTEYVCFVNSDHRVCKSCWEPLAKGHKCKPDAKESIKTIRGDTKACPTCGSRVHRIEGCNSMWCTACKTGFDYRTGEVIKNVQNPHLNEYRLQQAGRGGMSVDACGGIVSIGNFAKDLEAIKGFGVDKLKALEGAEEIKITSWCSKKEKFSFETILIDIAEVTENLNDRLNERYIPRMDWVIIQYLVGELNEKEFAHKTFLKQREEARVDAKRQIYVTGRTLLSERLGELQTTLKGLKLTWKEKIFDAFVDFVKECNSIRKFINSTFTSELVPLGTNSPPQISLDWRWSDDKYSSGDGRYYRSPLVVPRANPKARTMVVSNSGAIRIVRLPT